MLDKLVAWVVGIGLILGSAVATADEVSFSDTFGPSEVSSNDEIGAVALEKFDPSLGTLTKITLRLDADTSGGSIAWDNESPVETDVTLGIGAEVTVTAPSALSVAAVPLQIGSAPVVDADNDGAADFIGTDAFSVVDGSGSDSDSAMLTSMFTPYIASFAGETFDVEIAAAVETFLSTTGGFGPIDPMPGVVEGTVTVTYTYVTPAPVPAPSNFMLLIMATFSMTCYGWWRRRKLAA